MAFEIYAGDLGPSIADTIKIDGEPVDLTNATVTFSMRPERGSTLVVNGGDVQLATDPTTGGVRYDWQDGDTDVPGDYLGWWSVTPAGAETQDSHEFPIHILAHGPYPGDLITLEDVRQFLGVDPQDTDKDGITEELIHRASARIIQATGREFAPVTATTRRFRVTYDQFRTGGAGRLSIPFTCFDLQPNTEATPVVVTLYPDTANASVLVEGQDYLLEPHNPMGGVYTRLVINLLCPALMQTTQMRIMWGFDYVDVSGTWGFPIVPDDIIDACVDTVASWLDRRVASAMQVPTTPDITGPAVSQGFDIPPSILRKLRLWMRRI
jgi:hypothetical protein